MVLSLFKIALILSAPLYAVSKLSYVINLQNSDLITLTCNVTTVLKKVIAERNNGDDIIL